jgi:hypothetical protein
MLGNLRLLGSAVLVRNDEKYPHEQGKGGANNHDGRFRAQSFFLGIDHVTSPHDETFNIKNAATKNWFRPRTPDGTYGLTHKFQT